MEKMVTRTVRGYKYTAGRIKMEETGVVLEDQKSFISTKKFGERAIQKYLKEKGMEGYQVIDVKEVEGKYGMSVTRFMDFAILLEGEPIIEKDDEE